MGDGAGRNVYGWLLVAGLVFAGCPTIQPVLNPPSGTSGGSSAGTTRGSSGGSSLGTSSTLGTTTGTTSSTTGTTIRSGSSTGGSTSSGSSGSNTSGGTTGGLPDGGPDAGTYYCDEVLGIDVPHCGARSNPCHSIFYFMNDDLKTKVCNGGPQGGAIELLENGVPAKGTWTAEGSNPLDLGLGVTLHAPGVYFAVSNTNWLTHNISETEPISASVAPFCAGDGVVPIAIEGDPGDPVYVGIDENGLIPPNNIGLLVVYDAVVLSNVRIASQTGIEVFDGTVELGPGPVQIGGFDVAGATATGEVGLECSGDGQGPTTVEDETVVASPIELTIEGQTSAALEADTNCVVSLTHDPQLGAPPPCSSTTPQGSSLVATGNAQVTLQSATLSCAEGDGMVITVGDGGSTPTIDLQDGKLQGSGGAGIHVGAGTVILQGSELIGNSVGLWVDGEAPAGTTVSLSNNLLCSQLQPGAPSGWTQAVDVWNASTAASVTVDLCTWNDPTGAAWSCPTANVPSRSTCTCMEDAGCALDAGAIDIARIAGGAVTVTNDQATNHLWGTCAP